MKVLICIPSYYKPQPQGSANAIMGSETSTIDERVQHTLQAVRSATLLVADQEFGLGSSGGPGTVVNHLVDILPKSVTGDVCLCVVDKLHLGQRITSGISAKIRNFEINPRHLGYACRKVMSEHLSEYDLFCFIEDDTQILDADFFIKADSFYKAFGEEKVFLPNRFEIFGRQDLAWRCYLDSPLPPNYQINSTLEGEDEITIQQFTGNIIIRKTRNLHSGCYVITQNQLRWWIDQPDFLKINLPWAIQMDPMEAAQVPLGGYFPAYKPVLENGAFFAVHHVPERACNARTPAHLLVDRLQTELRQRQSRAL